MPGGSTAECAGSSKPTLGWQRTLLMGKQDMHLIYKVRKVLCVWAWVGVCGRGGNRRQKRSYLDSGTPSVKSTPFGSKFVDHC